MALLKDWYAVAYDEKANKGDIQRFWTNYFALEKSVYEQLLTNPDEEVKGTVKELAEKYEVSIPIIEQVNKVLFENKPADEAVRELMVRDKKIEYAVLPWEE